MQAAQRQRVRCHRGLAGAQGHFPGFGEENALRIRRIRRIEMNGRARHFQAVDGGVGRRALYPYIAAPHGQMSQIQAFEII